MPWKECHVVDERLRFVARLLDGEKMTTVCAEFGISRKTGYKIFDRYKDYGVHGLTDRSRRPYRHANQLPLSLETQIVRLKRDYPDWGAPKIREKLRGRCGPLRCPAISTVHAVLDRHGLVQRRGRRRRRATGTALTEATTPNALWCADFKGEFRLGNRRYCYPLTITDFASRYLLTCEALSTTREGVCLRRLRTHLQGLRAAARRFAPTTGCPFASAHALYGLSKLSVWWLRLGVGIERIRPGTPNRTGGTSACISRSSNRPPSRRWRISCNSRRASMPSSSSTTTSARTRPWR